jgi:predicted YcjX-like family ATPase
MPASDASMRSEIAALAQKPAAYQEVIVDQQTLNAIEAQRDREIQDTLQAMNESHKAANQCVQAIQEVLASLQQQITELKADGLLNHIAIAVMAAETPPPCESDSFPYFKNPPGNCSRH